MVSHGQLYNAKAIEKYFTQQYKTNVVYVGCRSGTVYLASPYLLLSMPKYEYDGLNLPFIERPPSDDDVTYRYSKPWKASGARYPESISQVMERHVTTGPAMEYRPTSYARLVDDQRKTRVARIYLNVSDDGDPLLLFDDQIPLFQPDPALRRRVVPSTVALHFYWKGTNYGVTVVRGSDVIGIIMPVDVHPGEFAIFAERLTSAVAAYAV